MEVYFDDFKVTHTKSAVVQSNDCFAFGMDNSALSYQRENMIKNNFLYNAGSEQQVNVDANLYDMPYRGMDVSIGRMMQIDPMSDRYSSMSPYNYAFNNPIFLNDPGGASPYDDGFETGRDYGTLGATENIMPNTSLDDFVRNVRNSPYGGTWSSSGHSYLFQSSEEAFAYGAAYNDYHDSWANTEYGNYDKSLIAFQWIQSTGETPSIAMVNALSDGLSPDFMSMNACLTCNIFDQPNGSDFGLAERAPNSAYTKRANTIGVADLFYEFITGTGPERSLFTEGHPLTEQIKQSYIVSVAKLQFTLGGSKAMIREDIPFGILGAALSGGNLTAQFVGGARVSIIPTSAGTLYVVDNTTGRYSFEAHSAPDIPRDPNFMTPEGNIYQRFIWIDN